MEYYYSWYRSFLTIIVRKSSHGTLLSFPSTVVFVQCLSETTQRMYYLIPNSSTRATKRRGKNTISYRMMFALVCRHSLFDGKYASWEREKNDRKHGCKKSQPVGVWYIQGVQLALRTKSYWWGFMISFL